MAITVQCGGCGKQFRADERFVGKRMRCKSCGTIFLVAAAAGAGGASADGSVGLDAGDSLLNDLAEAASERTRAGDPGAVGADAPSPPLSPAAPGWVPPVQVYAADEPVQMRGGIRRSVAFDFPFAPLLDAWVPRVIVFGSLAWLLCEAWYNQRPPGQNAAFGWIPLARLALLLALYAIVILPITVRGIEQAAQKLRFTYPPAPGWRTFATFFFPFTLGYIQWHVGGGNVRPVIVGCAAGLVISLGLFWFLFRQVPRELPLSFAYAAGSFLVSAALVAVILIGLNLLVLNVAQAMRHAHQFASSPLGPGLKWDSTPPPPEAASAERKPEESKKPRASRTPPAPAPSNGGTNGARPATPAKPATSAENAEPGTPPAAPTDASSPRQPSIFDEESFAASGSGTSSSASSADDRPAVASAVRPSPTRKPARIAVRPAPKVVDVGSGPLPTANSDVIKPITEAPVDGFDRIVFPKTPSMFFALVRGSGSGGGNDGGGAAAGDDEDEIELWDSSRYELKSAVRFRHDGDASEQNYILSPDGKYLLRLVNWPRWIVQVWSFETEEVIQNISLNEQYGTPRLVGFSSDEVFIVSWRKGSMQAIESFNASTGKRVKQIDLPEHERSEANFAISANGLRGAIAARDQYGKPVIQVIDLTGGMGAKRWEIQSLRDRAIARPAGLAYSREGDKLVALFEQGSQVLVVAWRIGDGRQLFEQIIQNDRSAAAAALPRPTREPPPAAPLRNSRPPTARGGSAGGADLRAGGASPSSSDVYYTAKQLPSTLDWLPDGSALVVRGKWLLDGRTGEKLADIPLATAVAQRALDDRHIEVVFSAASGQSRLAVVELDPQALAKAVSQPSPREP